MKFEICTNTEWWRVFSSLDFEGIEDCFEDRAADHFVGEFWSQLEMAGFEVERPRPHRSTLHGWNGANTFTWIGPGIGTFETPSQDEIKAVFDLFNATESKWRAEWTK